MNPVVLDFSVVLFIRIYMYFILILMVRTQKETIGEDQHRDGKAHMIDRNVYDWARRLEFVAIFSARITWALYLWAFEFPLHGVDPRATAFLYPDS